MVAHSPHGPQDCKWQPCPYIADIAVIKEKLSDIDDRLDAFINTYRRDDERIRTMEIYLAKQNGVRSQQRYDYKTVLFILMFVVTLLGSVASFWKA